MLGKPFFKSCQFCWLDIVFPRSKWVIVMQPWPWPPLSPPYGQNCTAPHCMCSTVRYSVLHCCAALQDCSPVQFSLEQWYDVMPLASVRGRAASGHYGLSTMAEYSYMKQNMSVKLKTSHLPSNSYPKKYKKKKICLTLPLLNQRLCKYTPAMTIG